MSSDHEGFGESLCLRTVYGFERWMAEVRGYHYYLRHRARLAPLCDRIRRDWAARQPRGRAA